MIIIVIHGLEMDAASALSKAISDKVETKRYSCQTKVDICPVNGDQVRPHIRVKVDSEGRDYAAELQNLIAAIADNNPCIENDADFVRL